MGWRRSLSANAANATTALSRLGTCAMQASDPLLWVVVCRGVVDGIEPVIHQTRTPEGHHRVARMVRVVDCDAQETRWIVESIWLSTSSSKAEDSGEPQLKLRRSASRWKRSRRHAR